VEPGVVVQTYNPSYLGGREAGRFSVQGQAGKVRYQMTHMYRQTRGKSAKQILRNKWNRKIEQSKCICTFGGRGWLPPNVYTCK
jgi:hypothetical protein